jgi:lysozyme
MKRLILSAAVAALLLVGCDGGHSGSSPPVVSSQPATTYIPPESSVVPDGAKPEAPPVSLLPLTVVAKHISAKGLHLIEGFEGWSSCPYWDPYGHVWTRGYGETEGIGSGSACISRARGEANLKRLVESRYEWALRALGVPLNPNQWDALCSFVWNLGAGIFQGTTVGSDLRGHRFGLAAGAMLAYVHAGGQVLSGLVTRRRAEVHLFLTPVRPAGPSRAQLKRQLYRDYRYRAHLRAVLVAQHCRVTHPSRHCRGVIKSGAAVNKAIRGLHRKGVR